MRLFSLIYIVAVWTTFCLVGSLGASDKKPHGHQGALEPYNGKPLPLTLTAEQKKKLDKGDTVS